MATKQEKIQEGIELIIYKTLPVVTRSSKRALRDAIWQYLLSQGVEFLDRLDN